MKTTKTAKEKLAGLVRVISIPPVMVTALLLILYFWGPQPFCPVGEPGHHHSAAGLCAGAGLSGAAAVPPLPQPRPGGSAGGGVCLYRGGVYHCLFVGAAGGGLAGDPHHLCRVFFSALFLTLCNRVLHRRASGHACSAAGPLLFLIYYFGWWMLLPSIVIGWLVAWASVELKRHTPTDLLWGALCSAAGFAIAVLWF